MTIQHKNDVDECQNDVYAGYEIKNPVSNDLFQIQFIIKPLSQRNPALQIRQRGWKHRRVTKNNFTELHEFVNLLNTPTNTMVWLLLSSSLRQISVMY